LIGKTHTHVFGYTRLYIYILLLKHLCTLLPLEVVDKWLNLGENVKNDPIYD